MSLVLPLLPQNLIVMDAETRVHGVKTNALAVFLCCGKRDYAYGKATFYN